MITLISSKNLGVCNNMRYTVIGETFEPKNTLCHSFGIIFIPFVSLFPSVLLQISEERIPEERIPEEQIPNVYLTSKLVIKIGVRYVCVKNCHMAHFHVIKTWIILMMMTVM